MRPISFLGKKAGHQKLKIIINGWEFYGTASYDSERAVRINSLREGVLLSGSASAKTAAAKILPY